MDSHLIYTVSSHKKCIANWNDWIYCGIEDDIKEDVINKSITEYFQSPTLYFVINRRESLEIRKDHLLQNIKT